MAARSLFLQQPENALRHLTTLTKGLKKIAIAGWIGGVASTILAVLVTHSIAPPAAAPSATPGVHEISGVLFVAWFMALAMLLFSTLYFIAGWGLAQRKPWGRYAGAASFLVKILLCVWLGRGSFAAMFVFLLIAAWDFYGLWVLLSKETALLLEPSPQISASAARANKPSATQTC